jgi:hypothetical protein
MLEEKKQREKCREMQKSINALENALLMQEAKINNQSANQFVSR